MRIIVRGGIVGESNLPHVSAYKIQIRLELSTFNVDFLVRGLVLPVFVIFKKFAFWELMRNGDKRDWSIPCDHAWKAEKQV